MSEPEKESVLENKLYKFSSSTKVPTPTKEQKARPPKPISKKLFYLYPSFIIFVSIIFLIYTIFFYKKIEIWNLLIIILLIPLNIVSWIALLGKLFSDRHKIKQKAIPIVTRNFIVMNFLTNNKRIMKRLVTLNSDGISCDIGERTYIIDKKTIWFDEKNYANSFYFPEIPNPLKFNVEGTIQQFLKSVRSEKKTTNTDYSGEVVDISFSSTNLQLFKKNKIFDELNKNPSADKLQMALIVVIIVLIIVLGLAIAL